ncbi:hypothetical protein FQR65_LT07716 [Abscondita terminalis]|nr:hypothetical protein FQR65_LT07716 [Abscondita terminalis]
MDLPYKVEYAKSGRASCRGCKNTIEKDVLRLAVMVQSPMFDGKVPNWYHSSCFFRKQRPKTVDDIEHFESLRWEDQESLKSKIGASSEIIVPDQKGKKRDAKAVASKKSALKDFIIEYSKSSRALCRGCEQKIMKEEIRISKKDFETDVGKRYGGQDMWHHVSCFAKLRSELGYFESANALPGFKALNKDDQKSVLTELPAIKQEEIPEKKAKIEDVVDGVDEALEKKLKEQTKLIYKYRDNLKELHKKELTHLLEVNDQEVPSGVESILDALSDVMAFGALQSCTECKMGQFRLDKLGYVCHGNVTEWSKCNYVTKEPPRAPFKVPKELAEQYSFLKKYKYVRRTRIFKDVKPSVSAMKVKKEEENGGPKIQRDTPPLYNMEFVIVGKLDVDKNELKKLITKLGGKVVTKIKETVMAVISTEAEVEKMGSRISEAQSAEVHVVPLTFLDEATEHNGRIPELITKKSICSWGSDPHTRLPPEPSSSKSKSKSGKMFSSAPSTIKFKVKGGTAVDPESGLEDCAHVYVSGKDKYTAVLGLTDIQKQKNSFYKLQLLEADRGNRYWLFRAWGRTGTTIGSTKLEDFDTLYDAKKEFYRIYEEKTGNDWNNRSNFVKVPNRMYPIDLDYGEDDEAKLNIDLEIPSKLSKPVQNLIQLIFNVDNMKKVMLEFELNTEEMPLGKLSKAQLQNAYNVLTELQQLVESNAPELRFIDASNRFYTFVPHTFGVDEVPVINDLETIKKKVEMVENLMELEVAYNLMKATGNNHSVDAYYDQLKTEIDVLDRKSEEFKVISQYVKNTHAATHSNYKLVIEEVYTIKRQGEERRYKPFRKLHNRKLLWHGSRTTNYAGILSQGLRIAPPEAPVTGYMFGKGIYFADMVSKSANYCCTDPSNNVGLMLLSEVALGEMYELYQAKYVEKLPKGKHSVKGVGRTEPDPESTVKIKSDIEVPVGKGIQPKRPQNSALLYNEFIVYDVAQVNIKYLLKLNFKYQY